MKDKLLGSRISGGNSAYKRIESDFYPTPPDVTYALLNFIKPNTEKTVVWEPACGEGHIVKEIQKMGYSVFGTDIKTGTDFLRDDAPRYYNWIITNPPFSIADKFILRCAELRRPFALLLKSQYWHAKKRLQLYRENVPTYILPLTWRPDFLFGERGGGSPLMDVMWCVWEPFSKDRGIYIPLERPDFNTVDVGF